MPSYDSLQKKYKDFRTPQVAIYVKGKKVDLTKYELMDVVVESTAESEKAGGCEMTFAGIFDAKKSKLDTSLMSMMQVNATLEVRMGYTTPTCVFYGKIDSVEVSFAFGENGPTLRVTGIDAKGLLMKARENESKNLESTKDVVSGILNQCKSDDAAKSVDVGNLLKFETPLRQENTSDFKFLCEVARMTNCLFFVSCGKITFKDVLTKSKASITLKWGKSLMSFNMTRDLSQQVSKVVVNGAKLNESEAVKGECNTVSMGGKGKVASSAYKSVKPEIEIENALATTEAIAKAIAKSELNLIAMQYITCEGRCIGLPDIEVGKWMEVEGMSDYVDSSYFIYKVKHTFNSSGFLTHFTLKGARAPK